MTDDATFEAAKARFGQKLRASGSAHRQRDYVLAGMAKCAAAHGSQVASCGVTDSPPSRAGTSLPLASAW